jgi:diacylglycerol kinase
MKSSSVFDSFRYAFAGVAHAFRTQRNMKVHAAVAAAVCAAGVAFGVSRVEWAVLALTIGLVVQVEIMNTAIEAVVDKASPESHPLARVAKDCAAGAVVVSAITAVIVGAIIFLPRIAALAGW